MLLLFCDAVVLSPPFVFSHFPVSGVARRTVKAKARLVFRFPFSEKNNLMHAPKARQGPFDLRD